MAKLTKERVDELEKEVAELKLIVHELRKSSTVEEVSASVVEDTIEFEGKPYKKVDRLACEGDVVVLTGDDLPKWFTNGKAYKVNGKNEITDDAKEYNNYPVYSAKYGRTPETVDVYELIEQPTVIVKGPLMAHIHEVAEKPKTANELRGEIIEKAKSFVVENGADYTFEVDEENRTVFAYKLFNPRLAHYFVRHGFSKCRQNDVFNSHIGKAIALGRVKKLDVSEFEQAVQPTDYAQGHEISYSSLNGVLETKKITKVDGVNLYFGERYIRSDRYKTYENADKPKIINDTNAIYGGC